MSQEYLEKALCVGKITGRRKLEGDIYRNLTYLFMNLVDFGTADKYLEKARASRKKIGDRTGEATDLGHLGIIS